MRTNSALMCLLVLPLLGGCVAVWGKSYKVDYTDKDSISIKYDPSAASPIDIHRVAQNYCNEQNADSIAQEHYTSGWGISTILYACAPRGSDVASQQRRADLKAQQERMQEIDSRNQQDASSRAAALLQSGYFNHSTYQAQPYQIQTPITTTCQSHGVGGIINTSCQSN